MQPRIQEKRRWPRMTLGSPQNVSLCYRNSAGKLQLVQVRVRDASEGGLGVNSPLALPVGSRVATGSSANGAPIALPAQKATVANCRPLEEGTFSIGLAYERIEPGSKSERLEEPEIWYSAAHGQTVFMNQPMFEMLEIVGWEDLGAKNYQSFLTGKRVPGGDQPSHVQATLVGCRGRKRSVLVYEEPLFTRHGELRSFFRTFTDLTGIGNKRNPALQG